DFGPASLASWFVRHDVFFAVTVMGVLITKGDSTEACDIPKHDRGAITLPCAAASAPRSTGQFALVQFQGSSCGSRASDCCRLSTPIGGRSRRTGISRSLHFSFGQPM